jgi:cell division septum initiation protein DivIVA
MNLLSAIKREERKLQKDLNKLNHRLDGLRSAAKALGRTAGREFSGMQKRVMSAATRAKIAKAARKRWAKVRSQAKKALAA